ncbi:MAG: 16S rRNA (uracil(1498)-N(3))-methyltransferase [Bacillota bacterium]
MHQFFKEGAALAAGQEMSLDADDLNHACRVLRLRKGSPVTVADGRGSAFFGVISSINPHDARVLLVEPAPPAEPSLRLTLLQALAKGEKMDLIVRQAVELGAARIIPVLTERSIPRLPAGKEDGRLERWRKIARVAAAQCRRSVLPAVEPVHDFAQALGLLAGATALVPWEGETDYGFNEMLDRRSPADRAVLLFIGPEGGFSRAEVEALSGAGARTVHLGPRILRTETAAAALTLVQAAWGDLGVERQ